MLGQVNVPYHISPSSEEEMLCEFEVFQKVCKIVEDAACKHISSEKVRKKLMCPFENGKVLQNNGFGLPAHIVIRHQRLLVRLPMKFVTLHVMC